jgi:filamentous hemagglutinin family protein
MRPFSLLLFAFFPTMAGGQIVHDGSLGKPGVISGPTVLIQPKDGVVRGRVIGQNVFYSFSRFDLPTGESARFVNGNSTPPIRNILARVTGGKASTIDGTIQVADPQVNLFLMNPAGFIFESNAKLDVTGSVAFTTADYIRLADDVRFDAKVQVSPVLSSASPAAFGFLGAPSHGAIRVKGSTDQQTALEASTGAVLSLVGGDIDVAGARLRVFGGRINLISAVGSGEAVFDPTNPESTVDVSSLSKRGVIRLRERSSARNVLGTTLVVRGESFLLENSSVVADTEDVKGGFVDIDVTGRYESTSSVINVATQGAADAGDVRIRADEIVLQGFNTDGALTSAITAESGSTASGRGGDVSISARTIDISDHANIATSANNTGDGGNLTMIASERITLDGATGPQPLTGIISETVTTEFEAGNAGDVTISAPRIEILRNAQLTARTKSFGNSGKVQINCDHLLIDGSGTGAGSFTGIEGRVGDNFGIEENLLGAPGAGRLIEIVANGITLRNGGVITGSTFGLGDANGIRIRTGTLTIRGSKQHRFTGVFARTTKPTDAGDGGSITIDAHDIDMSSRSAISASSENSDGRAGSVIVKASGSITVRDGASIDAASDLSAAGALSLRAGRDIEIRRATLNAAAATENGNLSVIAGRRLHVFQSTVSAQAGLSGGQSQLGGRVVALNNSAVDGQVGGVDLITPVAGTRAFVVSTDSFILTDTVVDTEVDNAFEVLSIQPSSPDALLLPLCGSRFSGVVSSFSTVGRGGVAPEPVTAAPILSRDGELSRTKESP